MPNYQIFPFVDAYDSFGVADAVLQLPLTLIYRSATVAVAGLLDSDASVNVLPYSIGSRLGAGKSKPPR